MCVCVCVCVRVCARARMYHHSCQHQQFKHRCQLTHLKEDTKNNFVRTVNPRMRDKDPRVISHPNNCICLCVCVQEQSKLL